MYLRLLSAYPFVLPLAVLYDYRVVNRKSTSLAAEGAKMSASTQNMTENGLRPVQEVARFLAISRSKVYQLMESGSLPYVKLGKSRRVRWPDVIKLVEQHTISRDAG
jgi:excisionase family DNA binding protein